VNAPLPIVVEDGTRSYIYGQGLAYAVTTGGIEVYHTDRLGSVRELTNGAGAVTGTYRSDEWGNLISSTGGSSQLFGYTGEPRDGTGLTYLRARYYDPAIGRFTSRDTWPGSVALPDSLNRYAYVGNNPASSTDHSGHIIDTIIDIAFIIIDLGSLAFGPPKDYETNSQALGADLIGLCIPFATGGGIAVRAGSDIKRAVRLGKEGEAAAGIVKNTKRIYTANGRYRIPDELSDIIIREVKNVAKQGLTEQLRVFSAYAKAENIPFELVLRKGADVTQPLQDAIDAGDIILVYLP
jgi:RHS repeat-associated protein